MWDSPLGQPYFFNIINNINNNNRLCGIIRLRRIVKMGVFSQLRNQTLRLWHDVPLPTREADATPVFQQWHQFNSSADAWTPLDSPSTTTTAGTEQRSHDNKFVLVTWNIDASSSAPEARISALISHIQNLTAPADIIFLQEVSRPALSAILETPWIRENWYSSEADSQVGKAALCKHDPCVQSMAQ